MDWSILKNNGAMTVLSEKERRTASILIVDPESNTRNSFRQALVGLGYDDISDANDGNVALEKMEEKRFTHILFDAKNGKMPSRVFLRTVLSRFPGVVTIPCSYEPTVDDVFDLLIAGGDAYLVKPFTAGSLDEAIGWATKGEGISQSIQNTKDRNEALASLILHNLDRLALVMRQAEQFETARLEIPKRRALLIKALEMGELFARGGIPRLRMAIIELSIERAQNARTDRMITRRRTRRKAFAKEKK